MKTSILISCLLLFFSDVVFSENSIFKKNITINPIDAFQNNLERINELDVDNTITDPNLKTLKIGCRKWPIGLNDVNVRPCRLRPEEKRCPPPPTPPCPVPSGYTQH